MTHFITKATATDFTLAPYGVRDTKETITINTNSENFYPAYFNFVEWMYGIKGDVAKNLLLKLLNLSDERTGIVSLTPASRQRIMNELGIANSALSRALTQLAESRVLIQLADVLEDGTVVEHKGEYQIARELLWRGPAEKRTGLAVTFEALYEDKDSREYNTIESEINVDATKLSASDFRIECTEDTELFNGIRYHRLNQNVLFPKNIADEDIMKAGYFSMKELCKRRGWSLDGVRVVEGTAVAYCGRPFVDGEVCPVCFEFDSALIPEERKYEDGEYKDFVVEATTVSVNLSVIPNTWCEYEDSETGETIRKSVAEMNLPEESLPKMTILDFPLKWVEVIK